MPLVTPRGEDICKNSQMTLITYLITILVPLICIAPCSAQQAALMRPGNATGQQQQPPRVLIIGAGLAGSAAARDLTDAGINDVLILEARDRPGGRLHSVQTTAGAVDLGAMWIHEATPQNPLYNLVKDKLNITLSPTLNYMNGQAFKTNGDPEQVQLLRNTFVAMAGTLQGKFDRLRRQEWLAVINNTAPPAEDIPISTVYTQWVAENNKSWVPGQADVANALMTIGFQNLLNGNVTKLSALRYGDAKTLPAIDVHLKPGFDAVPIKLLNGINVTYNATVQAIEDTGDQVTVTLTNGTNLTADYVILTASLGVLKNGSISFNPPLPTDKQAAIQDMGMGVLDKVVLVFNDSDVFWDNTVDFVVMAPPDWSGKWTSWLSYQRIFNMPVLVALNAADTARGLEAMSDTQVVQEAMQKLRQAYKSVPQPIETHVTRWASDPLAYGSYSYYAVGNPRNITDTLASPHGRVLFAGEATSSKMATALGALLSGQREAQRVINMTGISTAGLNMTTRAPQGWSNVTGGAAGTTAAAGSGSPTGALPGVSVAGR